MSISPLTTITETMEVLELSQEEIRALLDLIEFHDNWNELSEIVGTDVPALYDKISSSVTY